MYIEMYIEEDLIPANHDIMTPQKHKTTES